MNFWFVFEGTARAEQMGLREATVYGRFGALCLRFLHIYF